VIISAMWLVKGDHQRLVAVTNNQYALTITATLTGLATSSSYDVRARRSDDNTRTIGPVLHLIIRRPHRET
jgi:hypothetical protein